MVISINHKHNLIVLILVGLAEIKAAVNKMEKKKPKLQKKQAPKPNVGLVCSADLNYYYIMQMCPVGIAGLLGFILVLLLLQHWASQHVYIVLECYTIDKLCLICSYFVP